MKDWLTAAEIAAEELPDLPRTPQGVNYRAKKDGWSWRPCAASGGGREYPLTALPSEARAAYAAKHIRVLGVPTRVGLPAPVEAAPVPQPVARAAEHRDARLALLAVADRYAEAAGLGRKRADYVFAQAFNLGQIAVEPWIKDAVRSLTPRTLARWRAAREAGATHRLAVDKGAARRGLGILETANEGAISAAILALISKRPGLSADQIRNILIGEFGGELVGRDGQMVPMPPLRTVQEHMRKLKEQNAQLLLRQTNPDAWKSRYRVSGLAKHMVSRPLELVAIDASPADVMLTDGRSSIYVAIDYMSRRVLIEVTKTPRAEAVQLLLRRVILAWGVPELVFTDNGSDFVAADTSRFLAAAGIETQRSRPFSPEEKGTVERAIGTVQRGLMTLLDGFSGHSVADRKAIEGRVAFEKRLGADIKKLLEVRMTAADLQSACDRWVSIAYENRKHSSIGTTPLLKWAGYTGKLRRISDERALDVLLMPVAGDNGLRKVQKQGIRVEDAYFTLACLNPGDQVFCRHHPSDFGRLLVFSADMTRYLGEAVCPERVGTSRAALVAHHQAAQQKRNADASRELAKHRRRFNRPGAMFEAYLKGAAAEAPNVTPLLNRPSKLVSTPEIDAAAAAMSPRRRDVEVKVDAAARAEMEAEFSAALSGQKPAPRQSAEIVPLDNKERLFLRALDMIEREEAGETLEEAEARWLGSYRQSAAFRASMSFYEEVGRAWFEERAAG